MRESSIAGILLACLAFPHLSLGQEGSISAIPLPEVSATPAAVLFAELPAAETGIDFVQPIDPTHPQKCIYVGGYASPGLAIGDVNGDGRADVFITGGPVPNRLYLSQREGGTDNTLKYVDVTETAGLAGNGSWSAGATLVDIDNDGDLDIYVCNYGAANQLYLNLTTDPQSPRFEERAAQFGLDLVDASFSSAFCDYDLDGDLDVLVSCYQYVNPAGRPAELPVRKNGASYEVLPEFQKYYGIVPGPDGRPTFSNVGRADILLENVTTSKSVTFRDVTRHAGISDQGVGNSILWWDYNADGFPDLYMAHDFKVPDRLYRNNGDGTFTDVIRQAFPHTTWFSMGSEAGDLNNDGWIDLLVSDMAGTSHYRSKVTMGEMEVHRDFVKTANPPQYMRNALLVNTGTPRFLEAAYLAGLARSDWSWAVKLADFDNDGRLDVFISNGAARMFNHSDRNFTDEQRIGKTQWALWEDTPPRREENLAFRNLGDLRFENVSSVWGLHKPGMSYSAAYGDLDEDGDLDLLVANLEEPLSVYQNRCARTQRIRVRLRGTQSNSFGVGAVVHLKTSLGEQMREMTPSQGFLSCNEPILHFGMSGVGSVDELTVRWPSGQRQVFRDLAADHTYTITEPHATTAARVSPVQTTSPLFVASRTFPALRHQEQPFDDYARQPLLPYAHSQLGPGIAVADVDGDGDTDYYLGRAKGARRAIYHDVRGSVRAASILSDADAAYEDMGAVFFDAERDGDRDLFVVSGGVECDADDPLLRDRLYLNDGEGIFTAAPDGAAPDVRDSGGVVCAADFDRDGDLDLFVGGRVVPGQYPRPPKSRLLRNVSRKATARFEDVTQQVAPSLLETGLVTGAIWSDADGDGWLDLLVTHEWGPIKYFRNEPHPQGDQRRLIDRTSEVGLAHRLGWWNGIAARDLDHDGDIDYVVTNFGLNTQYHASDEKPELLFYGIFDETGKPHLLEAKFEQGKCFPRRGLSCSSHAMPFVREKVKTFHNFGLATLQDIYSEDKLARSLQLAANTLESGLLINVTSESESLPQFRFQPLPRLAQISPSFGSVVGDFDADGMVDIFLAQNFFSPQWETGRMDSGMSLVLRGQRAEQDGPQFEPLGPRESGIIIPGDAKACSLVDFNRDGWNDLLVTVNDQPIEAWEARPHPRNRLLLVQLVGPAGNQDCVGARVTVRFDRRPSQTAEVYCGGGYLSQSTTFLTFGCERSQPKQVSVRWPTGHTTQHPLRSGQMAVAIRQPK